MAKSIVMIGLATASLFSLPARAEIFTMAVFADFYECRHSFGERCGLWLHHDPNLNVELSKVSDAPETWTGDATLDHSQFGISAFVDVAIKKVVDSRISSEPQYSVSVRVRKHDKVVFIPWLNTVFFGDPSHLNRMTTWGPEFNDVDADLFKAKMFLYIGQPFVPVPDQSWLIDGSAVPR